MSMKVSSRVRYVNQGLVAALALWGAAAHAADNSSTSVGSSSGSTSIRSANSQLDHKDLSFLKEAAQSGQAEVQMGAMAAGKAQNQQVKQLAEHLQQDHSKANQELTELAQTKGVTLPTEPPRKEERMETRLQDKTGADFDKAFAEHAIKDHEKDITKYEKALQSCKDPEVKAFIEKNLPVLRQHLQMARNAGSAVGVDQKVLSSADKFLSRHNEGVGTSGSSQTGQGTTGSLEHKSLDQSSPIGRDSGSSGTSGGSASPNRVR
jgi:putative membrane protein